VAHGWGTKKHREMPEYSLSTSFQSTKNIDIQKTKSRDKKTRGRAGFFRYKANKLYGKGKRQWRL